MRRFLYLLLSLFVTPLPLFAASGAVECGKLLDVRSGQMLSGKVIAFDEKGIIKAIGPASALPSGVKPVDLTAFTCLPGLIDVHTHLRGDPSNHGYKSLGYRFRSRP